LTDEPILVPVDLGEAEFVPDPRRPGAWTLLVDGVAQSYVHLGQPTHLEFEYARRMAAIIDSFRPAGAPVRVLHLGAGGLTLPRYVEATRPGSRQRVIERDATLLRLVREVLPLPEDTDIEVELGTADDAVRADSGTYDLVIADVYVAAQMPRSVSTTGFAASVAALLAPDGVYAVNVADLPPLAFSRTQVATLRTAFPDVCVVGEPTILRGRRFGNVVLAASPTTLPIDRLVAAAARSGGNRGRVLHGTAVDDFVGGAQPITGDEPGGGHRIPP
jgi:spermidine synthase